jgi:N-dimethylarginine dimethylaminohydrolase
MKILISELPKSNWWGKGSEAYDNDWAMEEGVIPNHQQVLIEYKSFAENLQKYAEIDIIPFPDELDINNLYKHDAIFIRDSFISNQKGEMVIANFSERKRQIERDHVRDYLQKNGYRTFELADDAYMEGGEYYFSKNDNTLFSGISRSNKKGVEETAKLLGVKEVLIVETDAFHMDTVFTIILDKSGLLCGLIACPKLIKNMDIIREFVKKNNIELIEIDPIDSIDFDGKGKISVNCLPLPGVLLSGNEFLTQGVEEKIKKLGVTHSVTPITQFLHSAGGYHCLTNELFS